MIDPLELARHVDRVRRRVWGCRGVVVRDVAGGWVLADEASAGEELPSNNLNRAYFMASAGRMSAEEVGAALAVMRGLGRKRVFVWLGPRAWDGGVHAELERIGTLLWPYVRYPVMAREAGEGGEGRTELEVRVVEAGDARRELEAARPWYSDRGVQSAAHLVEDGKAELHAAFEGERPVGISLLIVDGDWGYLGFAGTDPGRRRRGAQSALIASRVRRAGELGARWCASETVTADETSMRNLKRGGFGEVFEWRVYRWDEADAATAVMGT